jgi:hypothetical protein
MACPWFNPLSEADFSARPRPARAPLGTVFEGICEARPDAPFTPSDDLLYGFCNFGYGRDRCPAFPADSEADAVRFTSVGNRSVWVLEKEHAPVRYGSCDESFPSPRLERQAEAFTRECLKKHS